jgi:hypothetical protein
MGTTTVTVRIEAGPLVFGGRLETVHAPKTCAVFSQLLPLASQLVHVRWSGEGVWIPFGDRHFTLAYENHTSHPAPGQFILYPGGISEAEILLAYGGVSFSSKVGPLAGNHFMTITEGLEQLPELGRLVLWEGAQPIRITAV